MVKWLLNESVNAYIWIFMNEIFHILMYKCIHKPIHHTHTPKIPRNSYVNLFGSLPQTFAKLAKYLEKPQLFIYWQKLCVMLLYNKVQLERKPTIWLQNARKQGFQFVKDYAVVLVHISWRILFIYLFIKLYRTHLHSVISWAELNGGLNSNLRQKNLNTIQL